MPTSLHLIRHAYAGSRADWEGDDELRPLSERGEHQAAAIADALLDAGIDRLLTSRYARCRQTLEPLGAKARHATLSLTVWPGGRAIHLANCDYHGRWIEWVAASAPDQP